MNSFNEIMQQITGGLTGDKDHDATYLMEQCEQYKGHEMAKEIIRACSRLMYSLISEEDRQKMTQAIMNATQGYESILEEAQFKVYQKRYDEALSILENLIHQVEEMGMYRDDQVSEYHCFNEFFEEVLYKEWEHPQKTLRSCDFPYALIYTRYGSLLFEMGRYDEARKALSVAMKWNPANVYIAFEHAETYKAKGEIEEFHQRTLDAFRYAYRPEHVARCLRNLGYYYVEMKSWNEALACYQRSLSYEPTAKEAIAELYYIREKSGVDLRHFTQEELDRFDFPTEPDRDVIGLAYAYGKYFMEQEDAAGARYCLQIVYGLTHDKRIKEMIDNLPEEA